MHGAGEGEWDEAVDGFLQFGGAPEELHITGKSEVGSQPGTGVGANRRGHWSRDKPRLGAHCGTLWHFHPSPCPAEN